MISRRAFGAGAATLAAALASPRSAAAQAAPSELMTPPALGEMSLGNPNASCTVIEYASLWCSHCGEFHRAIYPEFKKRYIDTGKIHFIFREFPITPQGALGSMLARCAATQGGKDKFFAVVDLLFAKQNDWAYAKDAGVPLLRFAKQLGFSEEAFKTCSSDQKVLSALEAEQNRAENKFGVDATPTFFVNGRKLKSVGSIRDLARAIDPLIKT
jgi:protein-disulfide isomerase